MNKAKLLQSILELHKTVKDGNMEKMYRCANELNALFEIEVPEPIDATPEKIDALKKKNHEEGLTQREALELITLERILKEKSKNVEPGEDD